MQRPYDRGVFLLGAHGGHPGRRWKTGRSRSATATFHGYSFQFGRACRKSTKHESAAIKSAHNLTDRAAITAHNLRIHRRRDCKYPFCPARSGCSCAYSTTGAGRTCYKAGRVFDLENDRRVGLSKLSNLGSRMRSVRAKCSRRAAWALRTQSRTFKIHRRPSP